MYKILSYLFVKFLIFYTLRIEVISYFLSSIPCLDQNTDPFI